MTLKTDLEQHIRESYKLIRQFEDILRLSDNPKEQTRSRRAIEEQRQLIRRYLAEYVPLCDRLNLTMPKDIAFIASSSLSRPQPSRDPTSMPLEEDASSGLSFSRDRFSEGSTSRETSEKLKRVRRGPVSSSLEEVKNILKSYLWGQFLLLLLFWVSVLEGLVGIFDVPPCPRRLMLTILTSLGGVTILCLSFLARYRNHYQNWDRWLTFGLLIMTTGMLNWLTYQECGPASLIPLSK